MKHIRPKRSKLYNLDANEIQNALDASKTWVEVFNRLQCSDVDAKITTMRAVIKHFKLSTVKLKINLREYRKTLINQITYTDLTYDELIATTSSRVTIRRYILKHNLIEYKCGIVECSNTGFHLGRKLSLQLDHVDGYGHNNLITNLRFLCPNCHSQTDTFGSKNIKKTKITRRKSTKFQIEYNVLAELVKNNSLSAIGRMYGVSDNAVRKRCISIGIDF